MTGNRGIWRRPYFFEIFTLVNFAVVVAIVFRGTAYVVTSLPATAISFLPSLFGYMAAGVVVRCVAGWWRGDLRPYLRVISSRGWLLDSLRLMISGALLLHSYEWIKITVPLLHPRLFDQQLWRLDQALLLGHSPNILLLNVFSDTTVLRLIDFSYARIFFTSLTVAFGFFLSSPSRRLRVAFSDGNSLLWLTGAWLYLAIPSLGPAIRFPDVWLPLIDVLQTSTHMQAALMKNYNAVLRLPFGGSFKGVQLLFGVAAFPSLHVAFQSFAFLWMRRQWIYGEVIFGVFTLIILIGSIVTGWHYLIDGLAGMAMAAFCYDVSLRISNIRRWRRLRARQKLLALSS